MFYVIILQNKHLDLKKEFLDQLNELRLMFRPVEQVKLNV